MAVGALYPIAGTLLSPMLAAAAMAFSSVFVLGQRDAAEEARRASALQSFPDLQSSRSWQPNNDQLAGGKMASIADQGG